MFVYKHCVMNKIQKYYNCLFLDHNSVELQNKLKELGYAELKWTVCEDHNQCIIASSYEHDVRHHKTYTSPETVEHYDGSFWNGGINQKCKWGNCIDCGSDEERFIELAKRLIKEQNIVE